MNMIKLLNIATIIHPCVFHGEEVLIYWKCRGDKRYILYYSMCDPRVISRWGSCICDILSISNETISITQLTKHYMWNGLNMHNDLL